MEHCGLLFNEHGSWFWASLPSKTFLLALAADALAGTLLTFVGLPGLKPLPWWQTVAELGACAPCEHCQAPSSWTSLVRRGVDITTS